MGRDEYLLDNRQHEAAERFRALSDLFDPTTYRRLLALGLTRGWRVWEVGAGGPLVPTWIAEQTGVRPLATDIDATWLDHPNAPYDVVVHDIGVDPAPAGPFDVVHARLVLVHVAERTAALAAMVSALAPGGWLVLEEADPGLQPLVCLDESGPEEALANRLKTGFRALMADRGVDLAFGRTLPRLLREAGLEEVGADGYFPMGGPACAELERATVAQIRQRLIDAGLATAEEIERHLEAVTEGRLDLATSPMITAWGRKPETAGHPGDTMSATSPR